MLIESRSGYRARMHTLSGALAQQKSVAERITLVQYEAVLAAHPGAARDLGDHCGYTADQRVLEATDPEAAADDALDQQFLPQADIALRVVNRCAGAGARAGR